MEPYSLTRAATYGSEGWMEPKDWCVIASKIRSCRASSGTGVHSHDTPFRSACSSCVRSDYASSACLWNAGASSDWSCSLDGTPVSDIYAARSKADESFCARFWNADTVHVEPPKPQDVRTTKY